MRKVEKEVKSITKPTQVLELPNSDFLNRTNDLNLNDLQGKYNLKSITVIRGHNTVVEIYKEG